MAIQLVDPNFNINVKAGRCLEYGDKVFGINGGEATARNAWDATDFKHTDRNFPSGVSFPVWFNWYGRIQYDDGSWHSAWFDHVAVHSADGKIYSSPLTGNGHAWFESVDDLTRAFGNGMTYKGWSEDITKVKVIEGKDMNEQDAKDLAFQIGLLGHATLAELTPTWINDNGDRIYKGGFAYAAAMAKQIAEGKTWQTANWKYVNYDKDVANANDGENAKKLQAIKDALGVK